MMKWRCLFNHYVNVSYFRHFCDIIMQNLALEFDTVSLHDPQVIYTVTPTWDTELITSCSWCQIPHQESKFIKLDYVTSCSQTTGCMRHHSTPPFMDWILKKMTLSWYDIMLFFGFITWKIKHFCCKAKIAIWFMMKAWVSSFPFKVQSLSWTFFFSTEWLFKSLQGGNVWNFHKTFK